MWLCTGDEFLHLPDLLSQQAPVDSWFSLCSDPLLSLSLGSLPRPPLHSAPLLMWANTLNPSILLPPTHPAVYPPSYLTLHPSVHLPSHPTSIHPDFHRPATHPPSIYPPIYHLITLPHTHVCIHTPTVPPFHRPPTAPSVYIGWFLWRAQMNTSSASRCPRLDPD